MFEVSITIPGSSLTPVDETKFAIAAKNNHGGKNAPGTTVPQFGTDG